MKNWYAVYCKPRQDIRAEAHLRNQNYDVFRPRIRVRQYQSRLQIPDESMFPRYLFIRLDNIHEHWSPIRSTRGVVGLVRWGAHTPPVPAAVIDELQSRADTDGYIEIDAPNDYRTNERIRIKDGPFSGYEALFYSRHSEDRVTVLLNIMQRTQTLVLPKLMIEHA